MATLEENRVIYNGLAAKYVEGKLRLGICKIWHSHAMKNRNGSGVELDKQREIYHTAKRAEQDAVALMAGLKSEMARVMNEMANQYIATVTLEQYLSK